MAGHPLDTRKSRMARSLADARMMFGYYSPGSRRSFNPVPLSCGCLVLDVRGQSLPPDIQLAADTTLATKGRSSACRTGARCVESRRTLEMTACLPRGRKGAYARANR